VTAAPAEVLPGLWVVAGPGLTGDHDANGWLLELGDGGAVLIDGGSDAARLRANLAALGYRPGDVRAILASHCHHDHLSFASAFGAPVHLHDAEQAWAATGDTIGTCAYLYGAEGVPVPVAASLHDGQQLRFGGLEIEVLHTPGHSPGGCSFLFDRAGERVLVASDTLWGGFHPRIGSDEAAWRGSLSRIAESGADAVLYGHNTILPARTARRVAADALARFGFLMDPWSVPPAGAAYLPALVASLDGAATEFSA
jgi:hydroxyacylglutathione hydrolase